MSRMNGSARRLAWAALTLVALAPTPAQAQGQDTAYNRLIKQNLRDPRISTELVDHMPASPTVPTPLKYLGRIVGQTGELTYAKDIHRYLAEIARTAPKRAIFTKIGTSEEGRDIVLLVIADENTIANIQKYKGYLNQLTDPRKTTEAQAQQLIHTAKPMYWAISGMHSPETGGPEMLMELAYRLAVEETPFIQQIRNNVITLITPVIEVDGREKQVDTYYFNKKLPVGAARLPLMYWGKYVQHDNNRDGMGQFLKLTQTVNKTFLDWHPTIVHDLHEAQTYLYASTGTGPYNEALDAITIDEWWMLAENDVMEMTKRGVPGVWTYGFYDGWVPNYMFYTAHAHNSTGRFYEVQSYGPDTTTVRPGATVTSREWFRPNPPLASIAWGPRNNTNIQESAILFALHRVAQDKELFLDNYWLKNKRSYEKGKNGPPYAWVIPAAQYRKANAADAVNDLVTQGLEVQTANAAFKAGNLDVKAGDYIIRADQPYRTMADMYFSVQNYPPQNPRPYDDTGWTFQFMRDITIVAVADSSIQHQAMTPVTGTVKAPGGLEGTGDAIVVENAADNNLMAFRFKHGDVKMQAAEEDFDFGGHHFRAGAFIIAGADRAKVEADLKGLGLSAWAGAMPTVKLHDLDIPRIGYVHSWTRTQDEGWVRAALDTYGVPYTYMADQKLREGNLRAKYDVIIFPHVGGSAQSQVNGSPKNDTVALPYKKSAQTPNLGALDQTDDIRGGMGLPGLQALQEFVEQGGTLITEGSTSTIFPEYGLTPGVTVENPTGMFARGSVLKGIINDKMSPIAYGYNSTQLAVYFNQDPVLNAGGGGGGFGGGGGRGGAGADLSQNITPMAQRLTLATLDTAAGGAQAAAGGGGGGRGGRGGRAGRGGAGAAAAGGAAGAAGGAAADDQGGGGRGGRGGGIPLAMRPRVILQFPSQANDILLSGTIAGAESLVGRAQIIDQPMGKGHAVMFAIRPFWRWQTQGTYMFGFNAILNWNDLNAGRAVPAATPAAGGQEQQ